MMSLLSHSHQQIRFATTTLAGRRATPPWAEGHRWASILVSTRPSLPRNSSVQSPENGTLQNPQRTKEHIPGIPLGAAALHTGNTSLLYLRGPTTNIILMMSSPSSRHSRLEGRALGLRGVLQQEAAALRDAAAAASKLSRL